MLHPREAREETTRLDFLHTSLADCGSAFGARSEAVPLEYLLRLARHTLLSASFCSSQSLSVLRP